MDQTLTQIADRLMHQQLYLLGRDIHCKHGNLLEQYGAIKTPSPYPDSHSLYHFVIGRGQRICLRGFGVFVGDDAIGGVFLERGIARPNWMPSSRFEPVAWRQRDLPRLRTPRSKREWQLAFQLTQTMIVWIREYENWIQNSFGRRYRAALLSRFMRNGNIPVHWNTVEAWDRAFQQFS